MAAGSVNPLDQPAEQRRHALHAARPIFASRPARPLPKAGAMLRRRRPPFVRAMLVLLALAQLTVVGALTPTAAAAVEPWQQTLTITFPTDPRVSFSNTFDACRSGCARAHQATDLMGKRMWPLYAAVDGRICSIDEGATEASYGRNLTVCGTDGNRYRYLHVNNDTPGTDDGVADLKHVYADGITRGVRVAAGQLIAYMGDSGNAEGTSPHLHFDIFVPGVSNPWGEERINPYPSLRAALAAGRISNGTAVAREPSARIAGTSRVTTAIAVSRGAFSTATTVALASSRVPHDALVAGPLAAVHGGPVLLSDPNTLDGDTVAEIKRLKATRVILVGEAVRLADALRQRLPGVTVEVVGSQDLFATSVAVANLVWQATGAAPADNPTPAGPEAPTVGLTALDPAVVATLVAGSTPTLLVQLTGDRTGPNAALDGATFSADDVTRGLLRAWLVGAASDGVESVTFELDGRQVNTERQWPWDLGGTGGRRGRDSGSGVELPAPGEHQLVARLEKLDHTTETVTARFTIVSGEGSGETPQPAARRAIVAKGQDPDAFRAWPDALAASWYGAARRLPVLLTSPDGLPDVVANALGGVTEVVVAGGPGAISAKQVAQIAAITSTTVTRLSGADRYQTAFAIASDLLDRRLATGQTIHFATGANWPDAVTAGAALAHQRGTLLLVDPGGASPSVRDAVQSLAAQITDVVALGGPNAVTPAALANVARWAV